MVQPVPTPHSHDKHRTSPACPGYQQSDIQIPLDGLSALLASQGIQSGIKSASLTIQGTLDRPDLQSTGMARMRLGLPSGVQLGPRTGRFLTLNVQRVNITLPITLELLVAECAVVANQGGGAAVLSLALKDPQLQDAAQRTPLLLLLQRNGFCGKVVAYVGPNVSTGYPIDQTAYVARVQVNATVTLMDMPITVVTASEATPPQPTPLFGFSYALQQRLPAHDGCLRVDTWQACADACAQASLCVAWTHRPTVRHCFYFVIVVVHQIMGLQDNGACCALLASAQSPEARDGAVSSAVPPTAATALQCQIAAGARVLGTPGATLSGNVTVSSSAAHCCARCQSMGVRTGSHVIHWQH